MSVKARAHGSSTSELLFDEFTDLNYAYRFGPPKYDVIVARPSRTPTGSAVSDDVLLPLGQARPLEADVGPRAPVVTLGDRRSASCASHRAASPSGCR